MINSKINHEHIDVKVGLLFSRIGLSPNLWTILSLIPALCGFLALYDHNMLLGFFGFLLSGVLDIIDGAVARVTGRVTEFGTFLDGAIDRYIEAMLYIGLLFFGVPDYLLPIYVWISLLIFGTLMCSWINSYFSLIFDKKIINQMHEILERTDRMILIFAGMLLWFFNPAFLSYIIFITTILANITVLQQIFFVYKHHQ